MSSSENIKTPSSQEAITTPLSEGQSSCESGEFPTPELSGGKSSCTNGESITPAPSRLHSVLVLITSAILITIAVGITNSFGILMVAFLDEMDITSSEASWAAAIQQFIFYGSGCFLLPVIDWLGWRQSILLGTLLASSGLLLTSYSHTMYTIYITYGILTGIGFGGFMITSYVVTENYWEDYLYVCIALVSCGFELGILIFAPLTQLLLDNYGWRWTQRIMAVITLTGILGVVLFKPLPTKPNRNDKSSNHSVSTSEPSQTTMLLDSTKNKETCCCRMYYDFVYILRVYCSLDFFLYGVSVLCCNWTYDMSVMFLSLHTQRQGLSGDQAAILLNLFGASGVIFRLIMICLPSKGLKVTVFSTGLAFGFGAFLCTLISAYETYVSFAVYAICLGGALAYVETSFMYIVIMIMGLNKKEVITAGFNLFNAFADLIGNPISGLLIDSTGTTDNVFILAGCVGFLGVALYCIAMFRNREEIKNTSLDESVLIREITKTKYQKMND